MIFEPKQKNKVSEVTVLCLFICAAVAFGFASIESIPGRGILQSVALVLFCAMIFIAVRYKFTYFRYTVKIAPKKSTSLHHEDDEELPSDGELSYEEAEKLPVTSLPPKMLMLTVERKQGNGAWTTECILKLSDICSCTDLPTEKEELEGIKAKNKNISKYKYFKNMVVPEQTVLVADAPSGRVMVYLEKEKKLSEYLRAVAVYNKKGTE